MKRRPKSPPPEPPPEDSSRLVTLQDIARRVGVSHVTVSLALRDRGRISDELRARIKRVAQEMNYRADPAARALVQHRARKPSSTIHSALAWLNLWKSPKKLRGYREFDLYWAGAQAAAEDAGYRLEEFVVDGTLSLSRLETILRARGISGIITPPQERLLDWDDFHWENFSIVRIGHSVPAPAAHVVAPDQVGDTILAYSRMRELGYERIGFVCGRESAAQPRRWFSGGYLMMQINEPVGRRIPPLVHGPEHSSQDLLHKLGDWLRRHKPDAVLTEHAGILALLKAANWKVPGQIGVAALSVLDGGADAGIYQNAQEIGRVAAETVIAQINRNERGCLENFRTTMIRGRWVDGKTLPPRA